MNKNGYNKSILQEDMSVCYICGKGGDLARHEVFGGANRAKSKRLGLWCMVCPDCHEKIHSFKDKSKRLKSSAESKAIQHYGWSIPDFIREIGRSYIE